MNNSIHSQCPNGLSFGILEWETRYKTNKTNLLLSPMPTQSITNADKSLY